MTSSTHGATFRLRPARSGLVMALLFATAGAASGADAANAAQPVKARIDASKTRAPISKYVYGQFIEHIAGIINNGLWAEMLDDRKFYQPIASTPPPAAPARGRFAALRRWSPVGPADSIAMDTDRPYAGDHSPLVKLNDAEPRGIRQAGLTVRRGKAYSGRIVLAGTPDARVTVSLVWAEGAKARQASAVGTLSATYQTVPVRFTALADSDDARLEITGTGQGAFRVGAVSLMPADNLEGFRPEVIAALKQLRSGVYRFPGGNFVSGHEWRDAIGERDRRPPVMDPVWNAIQPNDVGTDEFMTLCRLLDVAAAWSSDRKTLTVGVINPTESEQRLDLAIEGATLAGKGKLWRLAPARIDQTIVPGQRPGVEIEERALDAVPSAPRFAPFSVNVYVFPVR